MIETIRGVLIEPPHPTLLIADVRRLHPCRQGFNQFVRLCRIQHGKSARGITLDREGTEQLAQYCGVTNLMWLAGKMPAGRSSNVNLLIRCERQAQEDAGYYMCWIDCALMAAVTIRAYIREWPEWIEEAVRLNG